MATNLLILYPQIQFFGEILSSTTAATGFEEENAINAARHEHYKISADGTTSSVVYDYATNISPNFYCIARADLLERNDPGNIDVNLIGSNVSGLTDVTISNTLGSSNLVGPNNEDFVDLNIAPGSYRYWKSITLSSASFQHEYSKFWSGIAFDFGVDPYWPRRLNRIYSSYADRKATHTFTFKWSGITNDKRQEFISNIYKYKETNSIFLATSFYHDVLNEYKCIHCWIRDARWTSKEQSLNDLEMTFEEAI